MIYFYNSIITYVLGAYKIRLLESFLLCAKNLCLIKTKNKKNDNTLILGVIYFYIYLPIIQTTYNLK